MTTNFLISGASGFIGSKLVEFLRSEGHLVRKLHHGKEFAKSGENYSWNPKEGLSDSQARELFRDVNILINLSGENIASGRWNSALKARLLESRILTTEKLSQALTTQLDEKPELFLCASAYGFYGDRGDEVLDESSAAGSNFLAEVCKKWEAAADLARTSRTRVVKARFGIVLEPSGGALQKMIRPFKWGVGAILGDGNQYLSWVSARDTIRALDFLIKAKSIAGAVNLVSPQPVTNREFSETLAEVLHRRLGPRIPAFGLRVLMGREMAENLALASARVFPKVLTAAGFSFLDSDLKQSLRFYLENL